MRSPAPRLGALALAALLIGAAPAAAQTSDYTGTTTTSTQVTPPSSTESTSDYTAPVTTETQTPDAGVAAETDAGTGADPAPVTGATGTAPTTLAYTGGEPLLVGGIGALLLLAAAGLVLRRRPG